MRCAFCALFILALHTLAIGMEAGVEEDKRARFDQLQAAPWQQVFHDRGTADWREHWTLDGLKARVTNTQEGMEFSAGTDIGDADHAVLWTKQAFSGDLRIEFEYTRLDRATRYVNILYFHATGSGAAPYAKDIAQWANLREVPAMCLYFDHMNAYHVSFAAFDNRNDDPREDYIRARRYVAGKGLIGTDLLPDNFRTGMFEPGVPHHLTFIKRGDDLFLEVRREGKTLLCHWRTDTAPPLHEGRIGLRHMNTRAGRYRDFRVDTLPKQQ